MKLLMLVPPLGQTMGWHSSCVTALVIVLQRQTYKSQASEVSGQPLLSYLILVMDLSPGTATSFCVTMSKSQPLSGLDFFKDPSSSGFYYCKMKGFMQLFP